MRRTSARARVAVAAAIVVVCLAVAAWLLDVGSRGSHGTQPIAAQGAGLSPPAGYRLVWADEFNGPRGSTPDPANWQFETGGNGWGNRELQYYTARPSNASLDGAGHLAITARREFYTGSDGVTRHYTSALIQTAGRFGDHLRLDPGEDQAALRGRLVARFLGDWSRLQSRGLAGVR